MDSPTMKLSRYVREKGININKMARDTGIPYMSLYDSLLNDKRDRDMRVGEFFMVCKFLELAPENFADQAEKIG